MAETLDPRDLLVSTRIRRLEGALPPHLDPGLIAVRRGYFRPTDLDLNINDRHLMRMLATVQARQAPQVFSHASAAVAWQCPLLASDLVDVHTTQPGTARRTTAGVRVHRGAIPDGHVVERAHGLFATTREWTAVQLAATLTLPNVLLPLDHLLRALCEQEDANQEQVREQLVSMVPRQMNGRVRAIRHLRLADARSGSAGESLSRGQMVLIGVPMPDLQVGFPRGGDLQGEDVVDFDWPELERFGEFDGKLKYTRGVVLGDRDPSEVVWEEKQREDRVRRHRPHAVRWVWADAFDRRRLARVLAEAGIHPVRKVSP